MKQSGLLESLQAGHAELLEAIDGLDEVRMSEAGVVGPWSVKDLLAHITAWEAEMLKALGQARMGKRPTLPDMSSAEVDSANAQWSKQTSGKPLAKVLEDLNGARKQTLRQVQGLSDADLEDATRHTWLHGESLASLIASETFEHEREHIAEILAWRRAKGQG